MNFLKKQVLWLMMFGMVVMPMPTLKADIFTKEFYARVIEQVTIGSLTIVAAAGILYGIQTYYQMQQQANEIETIESDKVDEEKAAQEKAEAEKKKESECRITVYLPGAIKTKFSDVAGLAGAKADMQDIIAYLKNPQIFEEMGAKIIKGVLLNGRPGNGKTHLARAVAGEASCPFISVSGASFAEMYVGVGAARVREVFKLARELAGKYGACIIFIDEIDSIGQKRSSSVNGADRDYNQTIGQLLQSMDGLEKDKNPIIVLAATNRAEVLDSAITRPGRFDRKVAVTEPEIKDRIELLRGALQHVRHDAHIDIARIARITSGFSGAKLALLINEAAILATKAGKSCVDVYDIELAYDHITLGREILGGERNDEDRWETAVHEAGHAVGYLFGDNIKYAIHKASIAPRAHSLGVIWTVEKHESHKSTERDMKAQIVMLLCGGLAEQLYGFGKSTGPSSDLAYARQIAYDMVVKYGMSEKLNYLSYDAIDGLLPNDIATEVHKETQKIIDECFAVAQKLVADHKDDIEKIAKLLMAEGTVLGDEIYKLVGLPLPDVESEFAVGIAA